MSLISTLLQIVNETIVMYGFIIFYLPVFIEIKMHTNQLIFIAERL